MSSNWDNDTLVNEKMHELKIELCRSFDGCWQKERFEKCLCGNKIRILSLYARGITKSEMKQEMQNLYRNYKTDLEIENITEQIQHFILNFQLKSLEKTYAFCNIKKYQYVDFVRGKHMLKYIYLIFGVTMEGERKIIDIIQKGNDSIEFWINVFDGLKLRGTERIMMLYMDDIPQAEKAADIVYHDKGYTLLNEKDFRCESAM